MNAIFPFLGKSGAKLTLRSSSGTIIPRQFGPIILMFLNFDLSSSILCSSFTPSSPVSLKPDDIIIIPSIPASPHSLTLSGTSSAGVQITARSGFFGRLFRSGKHDIAITAS